MSKIFEPIDDAVAIIRRGGVYKQVPMFTRSKRVYVQYGSGYAWIARNGTSIDKLHIDEIIADFKYDYDKLGRMIIK